MSNKSSIVIDGVSLVIGDLVRVREDIKVDEYAQGVIFIDEMRSSLGQIGEIYEIYQKDNESKDTIVRLHEPGSTLGGVFGIGQRARASSWFYAPKWLEPIDSHEEIKFESTAMHELEDLL